MRNENPVLFRILPSFIRQKIEHRPSLVRILKNIGWLFADKVIRMGAGLIVGVWVARYLGPQQFGMFNYAMAFAGMFAPIASLGLNGVVVRDIINAPTHTNLTLGTAFTMQFASGFLSLSLMISAIAWIRPGETTTRIMVLIFGFIFVLKSFDTIKYWFESQLQSRFSVWVENAAFLIMAGIKIGMLHFKAPLMAFVWATLFEAVLVAIGLVWIFRTRGYPITAWKADLSTAKSLLKDSWPLILAGLTISIYMRIDQIMLGEMLGPEKVGIYSSAVRISEVWYFVPMAIVASIFPSVVAAKKQNSALYYDRLQRLYEIMLLISLSVAIPMTFFAGPIMIFIMGDAYAGAGPVLSAHIWSGVFVAIGVVGGQWYLVEGLQSLQLYRTALGAIINVALNLVLIPRYGVAGAAWATVASYGVAAYFSDLLSSKTRIAFYMKTKALLMQNLFGKYRS